MCCLIKVLLPLAPDGEEQSPLQPPNTADHLVDVQKEVVGVFIDELKSPNNPNIFAAQTADIIKNNEEQSGFDGQIKSTISQEDYDKITSDNPEDFSWGTWLKLVQPENNPTGSYLLAQQELN